MQKNKLKNSVFSFICVIMLTVAMAFNFTACSPSSDTSGTSSLSTSSVTTNAKEVGQGEKVFTLEVDTQSGSSDFFTVHTDKETVGGALQELNLIEGENDEYGLYVKTVNGVTADYSKDGKYWAFYIDGQYATSGVDSTTINVGSTYKLAIENA